MRLGWTSQAVAASDGGMLYRISHPAGAPQAYSEHRVDTSAPTCRGWPRGPWIYSRDVVGATQGGSSGSPVVNASGQVVGQLTGGCGYNVNDVCDSVSNATVDGALAYYYPEVQQWLDSGPSGGGGNDAPTAGFTFSDSGLSVSFEDTSSDPDGSISSWAWAFGDGDASAAQNPAHTYAAPGTYSVTLTVTDNDGATDSDTQSVTVDGTVPSGGPLVTASDNNGRTWTAHVWRDGGSLSGTWSEGTGCAGEAICSLADIRKRVSSVTFTSTLGEEVTVFKP
jgi:PKD repeat protein